MRLLLASKFSSVERVVQRHVPLKGLSIAYIPDAQLMYESRLPDDDRIALLESGAVVREVSLTGNRLRTELAHSDAMFVAGGSVFALLYAAVKTGFHNIVREYVALGKPYIGSSAGSMLLAPDLSPLVGIEPLPDGLASLEGIGLIPYLILPHADRERYRTMYARLPISSVPCIPLRDDQVVISESGSITIHGQQPS